MRAALLSLLLAAPPAPEMPDALEGFRWATRDPKTGQVTMLLAGKRAVTKAGAPIEVEGPTITFFDPAPAAHGRLAVPSTTTLTAERGSYRKDTGLLVLQGKVVVTRSDGTVVRTESLEWSQAEGRFRTEAFAELSDGSSVVSGTGLEGRMADHPELGRTLDRITLKSGVKTVLKGGQLVGLDDLFLSSPEATGEGGVTVTCGGEMTYLRLASTIEYSDGVEARDFARALSCRSLTLALGPDRRITKLVATGGVRAGGGRGEEAAGETFSWDAAEARAVLSGAPYIRVEKPGGVIRAAGMTHDRAAGRTRFEGPGVIDLPAPPAEGKREEEAPRAP